VLKYLLHNVFLNKVQYKTFHSAAIQEN